MKFIFMVLVAVSVFALAVSLFFTPLHAQQLTIIPSKLVCLDAGKAKADLLSGYGEQITGHAVDAHGNLIVMFTSDHTWTIARITPDGLHCALASGDDWEAVKPEIKGTKS